MSEDTGTLNMGGDTTTPAGSSPAAGNFDDFIPTIPEDAPVETSAETQNTGEDAAQSTQQDDAVKADAGSEAPKEEEPKVETKDEPADDEADAKVPFHKHPRWQAQLAEKRELERIVNEQQKQIAEVLKQIQSPKEDAKSIESLSAELQRKLEEGEISTGEAFEEQRKLIEMSAQQQVQAVLQQQKQEAEASKIQDKFLSENPDFTELRDSGELEGLVKANPLHDNLSAYYALKAQRAEEARESAVKEAVEKAVKETEDRLRKEFQSKRNAASLSESAAYVPAGGNTPPELKDTKKFGGATQVLANRLRAMREARA